MWSFEGVEDYRGVVIEWVVTNGGEVVVRVIDKEEAIKLSGILNGYVISLNNLKGAH